MLNFIRGSKAKDATAPPVQKIMHCGIFSTEEMHYGIDEILFMRSSQKLLHIMRGTGMIASDT